MGMHLVVGLGNPGAAYAHTRHNIGWQALDALARRWNWISTPDDFNRLARSSFDGLLLDGSVTRGDGMRRVLLLKPTTFMNSSGQSVQAAMRFYQLEPSNVMIVLDDLALPSGRLRLRKGGSSGGHNGLKDIQRALGTDQYPRLRIGIDAPPPRFPQVDYVLGRYTPEQKAKIEPALKRAGEAIEMWIDHGIDAAMNEFNRDEQAAKE